MDISRTFKEYPRFQSPAVVNVKVVCVIVFPIQLTRLRRLLSGVFLRENCSVDVTNIHTPDSIRKSVQETFEVFVLHLFQFHDKLLRERGYVFRLGDRLVQSNVDKCEM